MSNLDRVDKIWKGGYDMHESDWLPKVLLKSELIHICNILSLSEDGFRLASLPSRPVMNIRNVVSNALKLGIGRKKEGMLQSQLMCFMKILPWMSLGEGQI